MIFSRKDVELRELMFGTQGAGQIKALKEGKVCVHFERIDRVTGETTKHKIEFPTQGGLLGYICEMDRRLERLENIASLQNKKMQLNKLINIFKSSSGTSSTVGVDYATTTTTSTGTGLVPVALPTGVPFKAAPKPPKVKKLRVTKKKRNAKS